MLAIFLVYQAHEQLQPSSGFLILLWYSRATEETRKHYRCTFHILDIGGPCVDLNIARKSHEKVESCLGHFLIMKLEFFIMH